MSPRSTVDIRPSLSTSGVPLTGKEGINCVWWENMKMKEDKLLCEYLVYPKYPKNALSPDCKGATVYNVLMWLTFVYSSSKIVMVRGLLYFCVVDQSRLFFFYFPRVPDSTEDQQTWKEGRIRSERTALWACLVRRTPCSAAHTPFTPSPHSVVAVKCLANDWQLLQLGLCWKGDGLLSH